MNDFILACENSNESRALEILELDKEHKIVYGYINKKKYTPLLLACKNKLEKVALKLLERPELCNINAYVGDYCDALQFAYENELQDVVIKINNIKESSGIDIHCFRSKWENSAFMEACYHGLEKVAKKLLETPEKCNVGYINEAYNDNAFMLACRNYKLIDIANRLLVEYPKECNIGQIGVGETALIFACKNELESVALKILDNWEECKIGHVSKSYDVKLQEYYKENGTALMYACMYGLETVALKILEHPKECNMGYNSEDCNTALIYACENGLETVALKILEYPDECNIGYVGRNGISTFMCSCIHNLENVALKFLECNETIDINIGNISNNGYTALMFACMYDLETVALKILDYGEKCKISHYEKAKGYTALMFACIHNLENVVYKILENSKECNIEHVSQINYIYYFHDSGYFSVNYNIEIKYGYTALMFACSLNNENIALKILEYSNESNIGRHYLIAKPKKYKLSYTFLEDTHTIGHSGNTALMIACENNLENVALKILEYGTKCNIKHINTDGNTALKYAHKNKMEKVIAKILEYSSV